LLLPHDVGGFCPTVVHLFRECCTHQCGFQRVECIICVIVA